MEKVCLAVLVLLTSLRVAVAEVVEEPCCEWLDVTEWPLEGYQCPATLEGANATYCCGLCYDSHHCPFEEDWLDQDECLDEDQLPVTSGSASNDDYWHPALALIIPAMFLILFVCAWLWVRDSQGGPAEDSAPVTGPSSFVRSQLRARYGACATAAGQKSLMSTLEPQDSPSLSEETRVWSHQRTEDEALCSMAVPAASPGDPEVAASSGDPEAAASPGAPASPGVPASPSTPEDAASPGATASPGAPEGAASPGTPEAAVPPTA